MSLPFAKVQDVVRVCEMGPRDGLQNEPGGVPVAAKVALVHGLAAAGLRHIEVGSFVSPRWVPQMAGTAGVFAGIDRRKDVTYAALVPNAKGFEAARAARADQVAVFTAASETFCQRNINATIQKSLERFAPLLKAAKAEGMTTRGYVSCVAGCPYEGAVDPARVAEVAYALEGLGCDEISLGDTIGVGTPRRIAETIRRVARDVSLDRLVLHPHDTYGQALANTLAALEEGVAAIDASVAGLGGCPYAPKAAGNLATEDLVYMLHGMGVATGVDLDALIRAGDGILEALGHATRSKVALARRAA